MAPLGFDRVRQMGLLLPDAVAGTAYGSPALKLHGKMFACMAINRSAEPGSLVVQVGFDERDRLVAEQPDVYYLTDHYVDGPVVLVRLQRIHPDALRDLLALAHRFVSAPRRRASGTRGAASRRGTKRRPRHG